MTANDNVLLAADPTAREVLLGLIEGCQVLGPRIRCDRCRIGPASDSAGAESGPFADARAVRGAPPPIIRFEARCGIGPASGTTHGTRRLEAAHVL